MINLRTGVSVVASSKRPRQGNARFSSERHLGLKQQRVTFAEYDGTAKNDTRPLCLKVAHGKRPPRWETDEFRDMSEVHCWVDLVLPPTSRRQPTKKDLERMATRQAKHKNGKPVRQAPLHLHHVPQTRKANKRFRPMSANALAFLGLTER